MKTETWLRIILLIILIFLCVYVGTTKIMEGAATFSSAPNSDLYFSEESDLTESSKILDKKKDENTGLIIKSTGNESSIKTNLEITEDLYRKSLSAQNDVNGLRQKRIENSVIPSVVNLPLYTNAINLSYNKIDSKDPSNMTQDAAFDVIDRTKPTYPIFTTLNGQKCINFQPESDSYLSFPFINPDKFSFSFWIYVDTNDTRFYVIASITNYRNVTKVNYNCSLEVDIQGSELLVYCALPTNNPFSIIHKYNGLTNGWTFIAFTYATDFTTKLYVNNNKNPVSVLKGTGKFMANDIRSNPNYFILGKSGCSWGGQYKYRGYMRDFYFYALTLTPDEVLQMYCKDGNKTDPVCNNYYN